tara:strand:- start:72 stop:488 length:417 start_codon:yes stop_codon:yes gene_type:complete
MSTRSNIAIQKEDETVDVIYCHSDGYLSYVGKILFENYQDDETVKSLVALGSFSSIDEKIEGIKNLYDEKPVTYNNEYSLVYDSEPLFIEYLYLWKNGEWFVSYSRHAETTDSYLRATCFRSKFYPLAIELRKQKKSA